MNNYKIHFISQIKLSLLFIRKVSALIFGEILDFRVLALNISDANAIDLCGV